MPKNKYYVVWNGRDIGVFDSWEECRLQVENYPEAKYKSFPTLEAAIAAFRRESLQSDLGLIKTIASHKTDIMNYSSFPEIRLNAIAVDAACSGNPGPVEYRGVCLETGKQIFHVGPLQGGSNNMGEFLAIVHALALLDKNRRPDVTVYSDSVTALAWTRNRAVKTTIQPTAKNEPIRQLIERALFWLNNHRSHNPVLKWNTERWGEIPADFGRK